MSASYARALFSNDTHYFWNDHDWLLERYRLAV